MRRTPAPKRSRVESYPPNHEEDEEFGAPPSMPRLPLRALKSSLDLPEWAPRSSKKPAARKCKPPTTPVNPSTPHTTSQKTISTFFSPSQSSKTVTTPTCLLLIQSHFQRLPTRTLRRPSPPPNRTDFASRCPSPRRHSPPAPESCPVRAHPSRHPRARTRGPATPRRRGSPRRHAPLVPLRPVSRVRGARSHSALFFVSSATSIASSAHARRAKACASHVDPSSTCSIAPRTSAHPSSTATSTLSCTRWG